MPLSLDDFIKQVGEEIDFRYNSYSRSQESKGWAFAQWALELHFPSVDSDEAFSSACLRHHLERKRDLLRYGKWNFLSTLCSLF